MSQSRSSHDLPDLAEELAALEHVPGVLRQAGVLAWMPGKSGPKIVLVTSRRTGRWVFPKGSIDPGATAPEAAAQEALEEAGIVGKPKARSIGSYRTVKIRPPQYWDVDVELFPMKVDKILDEWIEADQRKRCFVTLAEARDLVEDPAMIELARKFLRRHR